MPVWQISVVPVLSSRRPGGRMRAAAQRQAARVVPLQCGQGRPLQALQLQLTRLPCISTTCEVFSSPVTAHGCQRGAHLQATGSRSLRLQAAGRAGWSRAPGAVRHWYPWIEQVCKPSVTSGSRCSCSWTEGRRTVWPWRFARRPWGWPASPAPRWSHKAQVGSALPARVPSRPGGVGAGQAVRVLPLRSSPHVCRPDPSPTAGADR